MKRRLGQVFFLLILFALGLILGRILAIVGLTGKLSLSQATTLKKENVVLGPTMQKVDEYMPGNVRVKKLEDTYEISFTSHQAVTPYVAFLKTPLELGLDVNNMFIFKTTKQGSEFVAYVPVQSIENTTKEFLILVRDGSYLIPYGLQNHSSKGPIVPFKIQESTDVQQ